MNEHDLIIIGGGPAGLTAGLYAARSRLDVLLLEKLMPGGQAVTTSLVENYPGFQEGISGPDLMARIEQQARRFGLDIEIAQVERVVLEDGRKKIIADDREYSAKALIVASGAEPRLLDVPGERELKGRGVSYCATCDGAFFRGKEVAVVGGGDSAVEEAVYLTKFAEKVFIIHRRDQLRAAKMVQERALQHDRVEVLWDSVVTRINGEQQVQSVDVKNVKTEKEDRLDVAGVFMYVGVTPHTDFFDFPIDKDDGGFLVTDPNMQTSAEGIYAAGDVRSKPFRQIVNATGEGAMAAYAAEKYLENSAP
jgi:thioredoxin reductase (NADPH)